MDLSYEFRSGTTTAAKNRSSGIDQYFHLFCKLFCFHVVAGSSVFIQKRKSGIGFCNYRNFGMGHHLRNNALHLSRTCGTVGTDSTGPQAFQHNGRRFRIRTEQSSSIRFKGQCSDYRQITDFFRRDQCRSGLRQAHHGLHHQKIRPGIHQTKNLLFINIDQCFQLHFSHGL